MPLAKYAMQKPAPGAGEFPIHPEPRSTGAMRNEVVAAYVAIVPPAGFNTFPIWRERERTFQPRRAVTFS